MNEHILLEKSLHSYALYEGNSNIEEYFDAWVGKSQIRLALYLRRE